MIVPVEEHAANQTVLHDRKPAEGELTDYLECLANVPTANKRISSSRFYVDITNALRGASQSKTLLLRNGPSHNDLKGIHQGELVKDESLSLFDAVSALEVGDSVWL